MTSWLKQPVPHLNTRAKRMRFYVIAITLVAASVPFLHLLDDQLSFLEVAVHTVSVVLSTTIAILLFELMLWVYLKREIRKWSLSIGLFWLLFLGVFALSFIVMHVTHDFLPITIDIWDKHIKPDLVATPWKALPIALLIGYTLLQLIHQYQVAQELVDLKRLNGQLQAVRNGVEQPDNEFQQLDMPKLVLPYKGGNLYLNPALIIRVESNENYCHVLVAPNKEKGGHCYMARITLSEVLNQLLGSIVIQVHRSHLVNLAYVSSLERQGRNYQLQLTNGDCIPVSRSRIKQIQKRVLTGR